ncbi:hypothetical protein BDV98DRAFT_497658 [Pterulicium gracile]|uniref:histidine kinase n=1 Tax=Pterulicium gracile TaxID=1884261 RepID=A0A5C3R1V7_9AGAR|nr:hypothetical protein BDV98DRAFT_497658 [Pterula gracilis]
MTRQSPSETGSVHGGPDSRFASGQSNRSQSHASAYQRWWVYNFTRYRMWPAFVDFFEPTFEDDEQEAEYQKMKWHATKPTAFYASIYLYVNWVLYLILNKSETRYEQYGGLSAVTVPIPFIIAYDLRNKSPITFQVLFTVAAWYCGVTEVIQMRECHFFKGAETCHDKDFLAMLYYVTAVPALYMIIMTKRIYNGIAQLLVFLLLMTLLIPDQGRFSRNVISFVCFSAFMQYLSWSLESNDRRMFLLTHQLKSAYRSQHKAQNAESRASSAKRRFASYIFHEVRVPLNTAMLAYQNLEDDFKLIAEKHQGDQGVEVEALSSSLLMMQTVLNDALDLDKMDAGRFESSQRPFPLHRTLQSTLRLTALATAKKRIQLKLNLDPRLDQISNVISNDELWVIGDDIRLRQVLSNLASNAVKFTPEGGGPVTITTKLIHPRPKESAPLDTPAAETVKELIRASPLVSENEKESAGLLVLRLEVQDSGPGIRPSDLQDTRLFQPFGQTPVGKATGKGSGLGLAIVRQIVHLSGGRLGIQSSPGDGAMFWIEMVYPIATKTAIASIQNDPAYSAPQFPLQFSTTESYDTMELNPSPLIPSNPPMTLHLPNMKPPGVPPPSAGPPTPLSMHEPIVAPAPVLGAPPPTIATLAASDTPSPPPPSPPLPPASAPPVAPMQVLVVDDDALTRTLMSKMLTKMGCIVDVAADGQQCVDMVVGPTPSGEPPKRYDFISLDNHMPVMTGEQAVSQLRLLGRQDYVVGCTGNALSQDQQSYLKAGANQILTKPIMMKQLKAVMEIAHQRRKQAASSEQPAVDPSSPSPPRTSYPP